MQAWMASDSFQSSVELWWNEFELNLKRDLGRARRNSLLDSISHVPTPSLMHTVEEASTGLAMDVKRLIRQMLDMTEKMTARAPAVSAGRCVQ